MSNHAIVEFSKIADMDDARPLKNIRFQAITELSSMFEASNFHDLHHLRSKIESDNGWGRPNIYNLICLDNLTKSTVEWRQILIDLVSFDHLSEQN